MDLSDTMKAEVNMRFDRFSRQSEHNTKILWVTYTSSTSALAFCPWDRADLKRPFTATENHFDLNRPWSLNTPAILMTERTIQVHAF